MGHKFVHLLVRCGLLSQFSLVQLTDLDRVGEEYLLARGGMGGRPGTLKYEGQRGQRCVVTLELKLIADVGMVG